jgi:hypothetical protein
MSLDFPWEMFLQAQGMKNRNQQQMNQDMAGLGQGLGDSIGATAQIIQQQKVKKSINDYIQQMGGGQQQPQQQSMAPQQSQQTAGVGGMQSPTQIPPGQPMSAGIGNIGQDVQMPTAGVGGMQAPPQPQQQMPSNPQPQGQQPFNPAMSQQLMKLYGQMDPKGFVQTMVDRSSPTAQRPSSPWRVITGMISPNGKPLQQNEQTGEVREVDLGAIPTGKGNANYAPPKGSGGITLKSPTDPSKANYYNARATSSEVGAMSQIEKNIDPSVASRTSPVGAAASSVRRAINGLSLLQQPIVTKTALEATTADIDSILTQGGATVEGRKMLSSPNFIQNLTNYRSFVSSSPDKVNVPPAMVNIYKNILNDLAPIQEKFVKDRIKQQGEFYRSKGEGLVGKKNYDDFLNRTVNGFSLSAPTGSPSQQSSAQPYSDPGKEARYQAWKKAQGL